MKNIFLMTILLSCAAYTNFAGAKCCSRNKCANSVVVEKPVKKCDNAACVCDNCECIAPCKCS